jgi:hypothetical protein
MRKSGMEHEQSAVFHASRAGRFSLRVCRPIESRMNDPRPRWGRAPLQERDGWARLREWARASCGRKESQARRATGKRPLGAARYGSADGHPAPWTGEMGGERQAERRGTRRHGKTVAPILCSAAPPRLGPFGVHFTSGGTIFEAAYPETVRKKPSTDRRATNVPICSPMGPPRCRVMGPGGGHRDRS